MIFWPIIPLFLIGLFGAWLAKQISNGNLPWWLPIIPSVCTGLLWGWVSKRSKDLSLATITFDIVYATAFLTGFFILGDRLSSLQILGVILSLIGVALMSL
jgi:drug/metabolite transporter (DMT)-like permease